jgi:hypothetical protein
VLIKLNNVRRMMILFSIAVAAWRLFLPGDQIAFRSVHHVAVFD